MRGLPGALPGLVSVLTRAAPVFRVQAIAGACRDAVGAFVPDPVASRLARLRRGVGAGARCLDAVVVEPVDVVMVTLTYRGGNEAWEPGHIREFVRSVRDHLARADVVFRYVWVAELQKRGVIHYHLALWLPKGVRLPLPDRPRIEQREPTSRNGAAGPFLLLTDAPFWRHGMTRIEVARRAVPYLMKYLSKSNDLSAGSLPYRARCHGRGGLAADFRAVVRWLSLPAFIQARASVAERWERVSGGGWSSPDGELFRSEFERCMVAGAWALRRVLDHGRPFHADGPFSWINKVEV